MRDTWLSPHITRTLLASVLLLLVLTEVVVIVTFSGWPKLHPSLGLGRFFAAVLVTLVPGVAGIQGYRAVGRLRPTIDAGGENTALIWLSRQFLAAAIFGYGAVIVNVVFLTELLRPK